MATLKYWLWLSTRGGLEAKHTARLLEHFGTPEGAYFADPAEYALVADLPGKGRTALLDKSLDEPERIMGECDRLGVRILTFGDADYPERLKNIYDPPAVLYVKGRLPNFDEELAVGVVGSRSPSEYGKRMAGKLGLELAREGALLVSGIAQGLDSEALKGALKGGGAVVSVLGCGVDVPYPWQSRWLYQDVATAGALVSEYPPGSPPHWWHFPERNRIISGLSLGVVAVECKLKSGTMSTVNRALDQDRDVFAVPGNADAPMSEGPNRLIQQGAKLTLCGLDVIQEYEGQFPLYRHPPLSTVAEESRLEPSEAVPTRKPERQKEIPVDKPSEQAYIDKRGLTDDQIDLLLTLGEKKLLADDLIERTQIPARRVLSALTMLQVAGHVTEHPGKRFEALVRLKTEEL